MRITNTKPILKYSSKKVIFEYINSSVINNKFINEHNLIFVNCVDTNIPTAKIESNEIRAKNCNGKIMSGAAGMALEGIGEHNVVDKDNRVGSIKNKVNASLRNRYKSLKESDECIQSEINIPKYIGEELSTSECNKSASDESVSVINLSAQRVNSEVNSNQNVNFPFNELVSPVI